MTPIHAIIRPLDLPLHELEFELDLPTEVMARGPVMCMAAWTPGSYLVRDHARFVDRVRLVDEQGREHPLVKLDKQRWQLPAVSVPARLLYRLYANELSVRTNHADAHHAHLVGAACFLYPEQERDRPWRLRFEGWPQGWRVATPLDAAPDGYEALDLDTLLDTPFEIGTFRLHGWQQDGVNLALAITGATAADETRMADLCRRLVERVSRVFDGLPFERYLFLLTLSPGASGGLEHRTSTSLLADPHGFDGPDGYHDLATLVAHEFLHAWIVKRLRPADLVPLDYSREQPTRLLWFFEGLTNFLQYGLASSAGVLSWAWIAKELGAFWTDFTTRAGRLEQSLEEASFDAWIRTYKPTEASANFSVSYYGKGALVGWMMEATLRLATDGRQGVEDLVRLLWQRHGEQPITDQDIRRAFADLGGDEASFWRDHIQGTADLDAGVVERAFGLELQRLAPWEVMEGERTRSARLAGKGRGWIGLSWDGPGSSRIRSVAPGSPAARAGLSYGMEVLGVQGWRTPTSSEAQARLAEARPGDPILLLAADRGRICEHRMVVEVNPTRITRVVTVKDPTDAQCRAFRGWTGLEHPGLRRRRSR